MLKECSGVSYKDDHDDQDDNVRSRNVQMCAKTRTHRVPRGKYTGEINFIASHLTSVLWQAPFLPTILVVQETPKQCLQKISLKNNCFVGNFETCTSFSFVAGM